MKSGYQGNFSLLFDFAEEYGIINEKEWLVTKGIAPSGSAGNKPDDYDYAFVRALLGLATHIAYRKSNVRVTIEDTETDKDDVIERLPSPIFFKVRMTEEKKYEIFIVANRINEAIYGRRFRFSSASKKAVLGVPEKAWIGDDFIDEFMDYVSKRRDLGVKLESVK